MFRVWLILTLASFCQTDMNLRLEKALLKMRQNKFLPRYLGPSSYLRRTLHASAVRTKPRDLGPHKYLQQTLDAGEEVVRKEPRDLKALSNPRQQKKTYESPKQPNLDNSNFCPMPETERKGGYQIRDETYYPYLGRVVASDGFKNQNKHKYMCTAALVKDKCYITAASCINTAKTRYTSIVVLDEHYPVRAFILPNNPSKQMFDDLGLIVIFNWNLKKNTFGVTYNSPGNFIKSPRSGVGYEWFDKLNLNQNDHYVVGFLPEHGNPGSILMYKLKEMRASTTLCNKILPAENNSKDYKVPCIHSCSIGEHFRNDPKCHRYIFGLGAVFVNRENVVVGIVTWTCGNHAAERLGRNGLPLPVGISVPNKDTLAIDLKCVDKIVKYVHPELEKTPTMLRHPSDLCDSVYE